MQNPFENAQEQLRKAAKLIKLDDDMLNILLWPDRVLKFHIPVKMDDGSTKVFEGFRSQHNNARGPYKGGIRFMSEVSEEEVKALSMWMTWKCATAGIPFGGGKGGVIVDPSTLSTAELERLTRGYVNKVYDFIGPDKDCPGPDVGTNAQVMTWIADEYSKIARSKQYAVATGKSLDFHGSLGREEATGQGAVYAMQELANAKGLRPQDTTIAIQGYGNVGFWFAKLAHELGYKIVALSDSKGGIYNEKGFDPDAVMNFKKANGTLVGYKGASEITNEELLQLEVDILGPAALENVITQDNAEKVNAKYIIELANGPLTPEADEILFKKGVIVVPDILANCGGVTVSYFEWVQNRSGFYWTKEEVLNRLQPIIAEAFADSYASMNELKVDMRMGTYALAIDKVVKAMRLVL